jgi:hypothetical protein
MKNKIRMTTSVIFMVLLFGLIVGCTVFSPIVGTWEDVRTRDTIEFTRGGDVIVKSGGYVITGKYELVGSDVAKVKLEGLSGAWMSLFGGDSWQYEISGDTMTLKVAGRSSKLERIN